MTVPADATDLPRVFLKRGRAKPVWHGHPWVYSEAVARIAGTVEPGAVVQVVDHDGRSIGRGFVNPRSQIRVRMVTRGEESVDDALIVGRIKAARALRARLGLPSEETTAYRLINSEGDGLPGLIVDVYGDAAVVQFSAIGLKLREQMIFDALRAELHPRLLCEASPGRFAALEGFEATARWIDGAAEELECKEHGLVFAVSPIDAQKTGLFLDQRENRKLVGMLAGGSRVLDCYSYQGGFALAALAGGAKSATAIDSSARALAAARQNAERNRLGGFETYQADVFAFLETLSPGSYDFVIVDPPKFAHARKDLAAALKGYERLNELALRACAMEGLLATSSCSQLVDLETFERAVSSAALRAQRRIQILATLAMGPDHPLPAAFPEGRYLKFLLCRVSR